ncbi:MAG: DUF5683 domain-containing protein [Candidatus Eisenbacteria bacterium]
MALAAAALAFAVPGRAEPAAADTAFVKPAAADPSAAPALRDSTLRDSTFRDSTLRDVKPFLVMARSAIVPGWGQVYNRQPLKAVVVVAGEGFLTYKIFQELQRQNDAIDRQAATIADTPEYDAAVADELTHRNRKIDWIWWTAAAHLLQMADAYVDAHLLNFDAEFGPADERSGSRGAPRLSLSLHVRF